MNPEAIGFWGIAIVLILSSLLKQGGYEITYVCFQRQ